VSLRWWLLVRIFARSSSSRALATFDHVAGDADIIGRGSPGKIDRVSVAALAVRLVGAVGGVVSGGAGVLALAVLE